jgi:O-antigen/teichoic acid export membrane protein
MRVGRSALGVFASNLLNLVFSFGNSIFLTRTLGVVGRGEFAVFSASFGILSLLFGFGLDVSLRYYVAQGRVARERILTSLLLFALSVGMLLFVTAHANDVLLANELFLPRSKQSVGMELTLAGVVTANLVYGNVASVFAGSRSFATLNVATVAFAAVSMAAYSALFAAQRSGLWPVQSDDVFRAYLALALFNAVVLTLLAYRKLGVRLSGRLLDGGLLRAMLRYAAVSWVASLAQFLNYRVDIWIVQYFTGSAELGIYSLAASLAMTLWMLPRSTSTVLMPAMASGESAVGFPQAARLGRLVLAVTVLGAVPLALLARSWLGLLYGEVFTASAAPFVVLLLGCVPFTVCVILASALAGVDRQEVNLTASLVGLVATVALDLALIPRWGIVGAAAASAVSYLVTTAVVVLAFSRIAALPAGRCVVPEWNDLSYAWDGLKSLLR